MTAIDIGGLSTRFEGVVAVGSPGSRAPGGDVSRFPGPDGAGQSTTTDALLDFGRPTGGTVIDLGHDARRER